MENKNWTKKYQIILWSVTLLIVLIALFYHFFNFSYNVFGFFGGERTAALESMEDETFNGNLEEIYVDMDAADLDIYYANEFRVSHNYPPKYEPKITFDDGKLSIIQSMKKAHLNDLGDYKVEIAIPTGTKLETLNVSVDAGDIDIDDIDGEDFVVSVDAGDIDVKDVEFDSTDISADAGSIKVKDSKLGGLNVSADLGSIDLKDIEFTKGNLEACCGDIQLEGKFDKVKAVCDLGDIQIEAPSVDVNNIETECSLGNVKVNGKKNN